MADTVIVVTGPGLGKVLPQDGDFGLKMFDLFLHTLEPLKDRPKAICFYTEGVKLMCEGSAALPGLKLIEGLGVRLVGCKTCLDYYGLQDKVRAGEIGTMKDIVSLALTADRTITI